MIPMLRGHIYFDQLVVWYHVSCNYSNYSSKSSKGLRVLTAKLCYLQL